jgi:hypothetical protein
MARYLLCCRFPGSIVRIVRPYWLCCLSFSVPLSAQRRPDQHYPVMHGSKDLDHAIGTTPVHDQVPRLGHAISACHQPARKS